MKNLKKLFSVMLAITLLAALAPGTFGAAEGKWRYKVKNGEATVTMYKGREKTVEIPSKLGGYPVTGIGENTFSNGGSNDDTREIFSARVESAVGKRWSKTKKEDINNFFGLPIRIYFGGFYEDEDI